MSKLGLVGAMALSLALVAGTPASAMGLRDVHNVGAIRIGGGGLFGARASVGSAVSDADAAYCAQRWAYYDQATGRAMGDDGQWRSCPRR
jgi:hypothetical protein